MAYSELVKNFEKIRDYMRIFYAYGFQTRNDLDLKSKRSYDDERRRIESWLGDYIFFKREETGKSMFISVDTRNIAHNPFFAALKAKSFTSRDIMLHFFILDMLSEGEELSAGEITDRLDTEYLSFFEEELCPDESTIRKKLSDYAKKGLLIKKRKGRSVLYSISKDKVDLSAWKDAADYFSEVTPLGAVGSYLLDKKEMETGEESVFSFKHHYLVQVLDVQIISELMDAMDRERTAEISVITRNRKKRAVRHRIFPLKIFISTSNGRQYILCREVEERRFKFYRLDNIKSVKLLERDENGDEYRKHLKGFTEKLWGVSSGSYRNRNLEELEMTIKIGEGEEYIARRLEREKRNGTVSRTDENTLVYKTRCMSCQEMLPWIRSFTGRIEKLVCTDKNVEKRVQEDLEEMYLMYSGEEDTDV